VTAPWVFVEDVDAPALGDTDRHHLERVLRVRPGDAVVVSDGAGGWRDGTLASAGTVEPTGAVQRVERATPAITVAFAITKGERPELAVQKLTELGADTIVPFTAARSVVRWDGGRAAGHVERLRRVAREAAMQSRRPWLPEVSDLATFDDATAIPGAAIADVDGLPPSLDNPAILVGPEGGWTDDERACGLPAVALGPHVLRAETAAMAAASLLCGLRACLVASAPKRRSSKRHRESLPRSGS
jgi:16S rRNA (uracil1498-N3)-methyltransferase